MAAELQMQPIHVVPGIDPKWLSFGFRKDALRIRLLPNDIWKLRGIGPVARYAVHTHMKWLANNMVRRYLRSPECQHYWNKILSLVDWLMEKRAVAVYVKLGSM
jgi:hypothetical protein